MLKICSHKRSGTHYLMALIHKNFYFPDDLTLLARADNGQKWHEGGKKAFVPWGKLFGTDTINHDKDWNILYLIRHPLDVMRSCWEFDGCRGTINEYSTEARISYWYNTTLYYTTNFPFVKYEELMVKPTAMLELIKNTYKLQKKNRTYENIKEKVGWLPLKKMSIRDGYRTQTIDKFRDIIGASYRGYKI